MRTRRLSCRIIGVAGALLLAACQSHPPRAAASDPKADWSATPPARHLGAVVEIRCDVPDCRIVAVDQGTIDGPVTVTVPPGDRWLRVVAPDRPPQKHHFSAQAGQQYLVSVSLAPPSARISIASQPPGALVKIDGEVYGRAPLESFEWSAGRTAIELELPGYMPAEATLLLRPGAHEQLSVALRPMPRRIQFESSTPVDALEVDDKIYTLQHGQSIELSPGTHRVIPVGSRRFAPLTFVVPIGEGQVTIRLPWNLREPDPEAFAWFRGGEVTIGSPRYVDMNPTRRVQLAPFWLARYETTVREYSGCVADEACEVPATGSECNYADPSRQQHPINCVSARDAERFARWLSRRDGLNYRLPTAQEWESVARAADSQDLGSCNTCDAQCDRRWQDSARDDGWQTTAPVTALVSCRGAEGIYHLTGNVAEFCVDLALGYVDRGGSFSQMDAFLDPAFPSPRSPDERSPTVGFRLVVDPLSVELACGPLLRTPPTQTTGRRGCGAT